MTTEYRRREVSYESELSSDHRALDASPRDRPVAVVLRTQPDRAHFLDISRQSIR
jgi:hypothetical protein